MPKVLNVILTHQSPAAVGAMLAEWRQIVPDAEILLAYGGRRADFEVIEHLERVFVDDPRLRTVDHQREFQSYTRLFQEAAVWMAPREYTHVSFCEFDHLPLVADFDLRRLARLEAEDADLIGYQVHRVDSTNHPHYLYHRQHPDFHRFWSAMTCREDPSVVLSMFGSGSFWTRRAFQAVASVPEPFPVYLEIFLPTLAHHLGFRVRDLPDQNAFVHPLRDMEAAIETARQSGAWSVHPVKQRWTRLSSRDRSYGGD